MGVSGISNPPFVGTIRDRFIEVAQVSADDTFNVLDADGITGCAIIEVSTTITASVGDEIRVMEGPYKGTWILLTIINPSQGVINVPFTAPDAVDRNLAYGPSGSFSSNLLLYFDSHPGDGSTPIAKINWVIDDNNQIKVDLTEYLKAYLLLYPPLGLTRAIYYRLDILDLSLRCAVNATFSNAVLIDILGTTQAIMDSSVFKIWFKNQVNFYSTIGFNGNNPGDYSVDDLVYDLTDYSTFTTDFPDFELFEQCYQDAINIVYVTDGGGIRNYVLNNEYKRSVEYSKVNQVTNPDRSVKLTSIDSYTQVVYDLKNVRTTHAEGIQQMINAVQAWVFTLNEDDEYTFIPIVIDKTSFINYQTFRESIDAIITFRYAETTQSQLN